MSLINDALKKAQTQEHGRNAPAAQTPSAVSASKFSPAQLVGAVVVLAALGAGAFFMFGGEKKAETPAAVATTPVAPVKPVEQPKVVEAPKIAEVPKVVEEPKVPVEQPKVDVPVAPVVPTPVPKAVVPAAPKENEAVREIIDSMVISLGRRSTQRCVINGKVHQVGDQVNATPQVLLEHVGDDTLTFVDANAVRYTKKYK